MRSPWKRHLFKECTRRWRSGSSCCSRRKPYGRLCITTTRPSPIRRRPDIGETFWSKILHICLLMPPINIWYPSSFYKRINFAQFSYQVMMEQSKEFQGEKLTYAHTLLCSIIVWNENWQKFPALKVRTAIKWGYVAFTKRCPVFCSRIFLRWLITCERRWLCSLALKLGRVDQRQHLLGFDHEDY